MRKLTAIIPALALLCAASASCENDKAVKHEFLYTAAPFPQCHASTIVEYPKGHLSVAFFGGTYECADDVCIYLCRKEMTDSTWSAPVKIAEDSLHACWNPVLYMNRDNEMLLFYKTGPNVPNWTGHIKRSKDGGYSWSEDEAFEAGMLGAIRNKPVTLPGGRIVSGSSEEFFEDENGFRKWTVHFELSDDEGRNWRKVGPVTMDDSLRVIQPTILTRKDGSLLALCRSANGKVASTISSDGGESWSRIRLTDFPNNNSGIDAVTLPDGRFAMVCNPVGSDCGARYPLCVYISDDGEKWTEIANLDSEPCEHGYCYPAVIYGSDGALHISYTWDRKLIRYARVPVPQK